MNAIPSTSFHIAVMPGDGIGHEVMAPCIEVVEEAVRRAGNFAMRFEWLEAGADAYVATGSAMSKATFDAAARADAILLGAMGLPHIRYPDGTEIAPQLDLRFDLDLYAGVRPIRTIPGVSSVLRDPRAEKIDLVIIRESTEGLFASRGRGTIEEDREARETMVITRGVCERLFDFSLRLGQRRRASGVGQGRVTCVDKANVFTSFAFFRKIFDERARAFPDLLADHVYIDASALMLVLKPWEFDVMVTENMFGDILSDLGAGLVGGMGYAPSADVGDTHAVFQPCHGSAPDIAGQGKANPTAMFLSAAMMLDWLGERHEVASARKAAALIEGAVDAAFGTGRLVTCERGGEAGTSAVARAVLEAMAFVSTEDRP
ncbi:isocitrate/isopropylmalate dehydrogenase family protein [Salinarimonas sp.]|uniref:isocitrate/isopropylmalate dehydrogenase family protein n=1 Tax=Salinarimonas sp. TaxID=2766526 RepID=UPI00391B158F